MPTRRLAVCLISVCVSMTVSSCAAIHGYATDPEDTDSVLQGLATYFGPKAEDAYNAQTDATKRKQLRETIVLNRMRAYQIEFDDFEKALNFYGSTATTGTDLAALVLNGLGATTGSAATKSALAAASAGIIGAQGDINKDLFYKSTLPALLAQMEANRTKVKVIIYTGLAQDDEKYPLARADDDLDSLKMAGSIPGAIANITQQAGNTNDAAKSQLQALSDLNYAGGLPSSQRIKAWLYPGGKDTDAQGKLVAPLPANVKALQDWMNADTTDTNLAQIPLETFVDGDSTQLEADRQRAIAALKIP